MKAPPYPPSSSRLPYLVRACASGVVGSPSPCRGRQPEPGHDLVPELADVGVFHIFHQHTHLGLCLPAGTLGRIAHFHRRVQHKLAGLCAHVRRAVQSF